MLNQNFARSTAEIIARSRPNIVAPKDIDYSAIIKDAGQNLETAQRNFRLRELSDALKSKDQDRIDSAFADLHPSERASWLYDRNAKVEDRDAGFQHDFDMEDKRLQTSLALEEKKNANAINLQRLAQSLRDQSDDSLRSKRLSILDNELESGRMTPEEYKKSVLALNLGSSLYKDVYGEEKPLSLKDFAQAVKNLSGANVDTETLNKIAQEKGYGLKFNEAPKKYANGDAGLVERMVDNGIPFEEALLRVGKMTPDQKMAYEVDKAKQIGEINLGNNLALADYKNENAIGLENLRQEGRVNLANMSNQGRLENALALEEAKRQNAENARLQQFSLDLQKQTAQNELKKDFETYRRTLPTDKIVQAEQISALTGEPVNNILMQDYRATQIKARQDLADIDYKQAQIADLQRKAEQPILSKEEAAYAAEVGKKRAQVESAERDSESMKPALLGAMSRAVRAVQSGNGVGLIGGTLAGLGLNTSSKAGANFADIQSANTQMNTYLRKQLAATGLTGSELNSAVEAEAYRYQINPRDPESVIMRKLQNFAQDKLGIAPEDFMGAFNKFGGYAEGTVAEDANGNRIIFRGGQWQRM